MWPIYVRFVLTTGPRRTSLPVKDLADRHRSPQQCLPTRGVSTTSSVALQCAKVVHELVPATVLGVVYEARPCRCSRSPASRSRVLPAEAAKTTSGVRARFLRGARTRPALQRSAYRHDLRRLHGRQHDVLVIEAECLDARWPRSTGGRRRPIPAGGEGRRRRPSGRRRRRVARAGIVVGPEAQAT